MLHPAIRNGRGHGLFGDGISRKDLDSVLFSGQGSAARLTRVRTMWLHANPERTLLEGVEKAGKEDSYMLIEDVDTGDILLPLIYMKRVFAANYSRKLSSLKHRLVMLASEDLSIQRKTTTREKEIPTNHGSSSGNQCSRDFVYWVWAFESPHEVKVLARQTLGEENAPQGHLRLILLPIVYSAMAQKSELRETAFFKAIHWALQASTYSKYFELLPPSIQHEMEDMQQQASKNNTNVVPSHEKTPGNPVQLFHGPHSLERTLAKYTLSYADGQELEHSTSKRQRRSYLGSSQQLPPHPLTPSQMAPKTPQRARGKDEREDGETVLGLAGVPNGEPQLAATVSWLQRQTMLIVEAMHDLRAMVNTRFQTVQSELANVYEIFHKMEVMQRSHIENFTQPANERVPFGLSWPVDNSEIRAPPPSEEGEEEEGEDIDEEEDVVEDFQLSSSSGFPGSQNRFLVASAGMKELVPSEYMHSSRKFTFATQSETESDQSQGGQLSTDPRSPPEMKSSQESLTIHPVALQWQPNSVQSEDWECKTGKKVSPGRKAPNFMENLDAHFKPSHGNVVKSSGIPLLGFHSAMSAIMGSGNLHNGNGKEGDELLDS